MQRFYIKDFIKKENISIKDMYLINQMIKVLRVKVWDSFIVFDWEKQSDYLYEISKIEKREINARLIKEIEKKREKKNKINLYQSITNKYEKIEYILQKWVEVWIYEFNFFRGDRSQKLNISENRLERFKKIIIEAVEQSGWNKIPELVIKENLEIKNENKTIFFHTKENNSKKLKDIENKENINLIVWSEWGFSEEEIKDFEDKWYEKVYLWENILRTETVWVVVWFFLINI